MSKTHNRKNRSRKKLEKKLERDAIVLVAYDAFAKAEKRMGISALGAFRNFVERLEKPAGEENAISHDEAKKILKDPVKFAELLIQADREREEQRQKEAREKENKDIAAIKRNTATSIALLFLLASPLVAKIEQPIIDRAEKAIKILFVKAKEAFSFKKSAEPCPVHPLNQNRTVTIQPAPSGKDVSPQ